MKSVTYEAMLARAKKLFGEDAVVYYYNKQWVIETGIKDELDMTPFEGTPALEAYNTYEPGYGNELERWMAKNGQSGDRIADGMRAYNETIERDLKESIAKVRETVASGDSIDWDGWPEYRDKMLKLAEEKGW